jgi:hypothetical protein
MASGCGGLPKQFGKKLLRCRRRASDPEQYSRRRKVRKEGGKLAANLMPD